MCYSVSKPQWVECDWPPSASSAAAAAEYEERQIMWRRLANENNFNENAADYQVRMFKGRKTTLIWPTEGQGHGMRPSA